MEFRKNKAKIENEIYEQKMRELDEFQDMLYNNEDNVNQHLLPVRRRGKVPEVVEKKQEPELSDAQRRMLAIDSEVRGYIRTAREEKEHRADI